MKFLTYLCFGIGMLPVMDNPVFAGKYNCEFQNNGTAVNKCKIDSANPGTQVCQHKFSANITGLCGVQGTTTDILLCALTTPAAVASSALSGMPEDIVGAAQALAQKPGFLAAGVTIAPANKGVIAAAYVEQQGAPTLAGVCTPQ